VPLSHDFLGHHFTGFPDDRERPEQTYKIFARLGHEIEDLFSAMSFPAMDRRSDWGRPVLMDGKSGRSQERVAQSMRCVQSLLVPAAPLGRKSCLRHVLRNWAFRATQTQTRHKFDCHLEKGDGPHLTIRLSDQRDRRHFWSISPEFSED
jgi:hypothetical protein